MSLERFGLRLAEEKCHFDCKHWLSYYHNVTCFGATTQQIFGFLFRMVEVLGQQQASA